MYILLNALNKKVVFGALTLLWKGMLAIFIVIGILIGVVYSLQYFDKLVAKKKSAALEKEKEEAKLLEDNSNNNDSANTNI
ncbi:MAG: hypothetical protein RR454_07420 [Clostridia bacterium]